MVNVNELMIGDYVDVSGHGNPIEVGIIRDIYEIYGEGYEINIRLKDCDGIFAGNEISPIALTKEFFLKNKFKVLYTYHNVLRIYCQKDVTLKIDLWQTEAGLRCSVYDDKIRVNYVHEFQHLLRLIGLSEMANNLKI